MFLSSPIIGRVLNPRPWHSCSALEAKAITVICDDGRRHKLAVMSCPCEAVSVSLARLRLWPATSKNPTFAFTFDLLDWMEALLLECQVSVNDFCKALDFKIPRYVISVWKPAEKTDELAAKSPVPLSDTVIEELASQERLRVCGEQPTAQEESNSATADSPISTYVDNLRTYALRNNLCTDVNDAGEVSSLTKKIERIDKELAILERANGITTQWTPNDDNYKSEVDLKNHRRYTEIYDKIKTVCEERLFLLKLKEKYSEGNALSKKLQNQIKKTEKNMKQLLMEYNSSCDQLKEETKRSFQELNLDLIKRQETFNLEDLDTEVTAIPLSVKRHAIEMLNLFKRCKEEKAILSGDIKQMFYYYRNDESNVSNSINMISSNDALNRYEAGSLALLRPFIS
ncbi:Hypothetical predicted protein [Paramuricea clavata]|uniref:Uncharacterized protein n=1 Tax=Paramuricea clavata TaxID=317549 RepID=A0A7D9HSE7_PARCT|nr:Hypothetical predicted protein [Paramuricea clavata]